MKLCFIEWLRPPTRGCVVSHGPVAESEGVRSLRHPHGRPPAVAVATHGDVEHPCGIGGHHVVRHARLLGGDDHTTSLRVVGDDDLRDVALEHLDPNGVASGRTPTELPPELTRAERTHVGHAVDVTVVCDERTCPLDGDRLSGPLSR